MASGTPDPISYQRFFRHLEDIDDELLNFCEGHEFEFKKNVLGDACRVLLKFGNPEWIIRIGVDQSWESGVWPMSLTYSLEVIAYYQSEADRLFVERARQRRPSFRSIADKRLVKKTMILQSERFPVLKENLKELLTKSLHLLISWGIPLITKEDPDAISQGWRRTRYWVD